MTLATKSVGIILLLLSLIILSYYTTWVIILPLINITHPLHAYFPDRTFAISVPATLGMVMVSFIVLFIARVKLEAAKRK